MPESNPASSPPMLKESGPESDQSESDRAASPRSVPASEGGDETMRRSKRKAQRAEERSGGNVIPLPRGRADASTAQEIRSPAREAATAEQLEPQPAAATRSAEQLATHADIHHEDDHPEIRNFFANAAKSAPPASGQWSDLENTDHDITPPLQHHPRAMYWTAAIGGAGLLFISVFLLYHKVLMPTPEELGTTKVVALPTPDMVKSMPEPRSAEPASASPPPASAAPGAPAGEPRGAVPAAASGSTAVPGSGAASEAPPAPGSAKGSEAQSAGAASALPSASGSPGAPNAAAGVATSAPSAHGSVPSSAAVPANTSSGSSGASGSASAARAPVPAASAPAARGSAASSAHHGPNAQPAKPNLASYEQALSEARKLGYRRSAEAAYLRALEANPKGSEALSGLAMLYLNFGDNTRAKERAEQALARDAKSAEAWIVLGSAQSALGKHAEARQAYVRCAALPNSKYVSECKRMLH